MTRDHACGGPVVTISALVLLAASTAMPGPTTDVVGDWHGTSKSRVQVATLGRGRAAASNDLSISGDGNWELDDTTAGWFYTGSWAPNGKRLDWSFDGSGQAELVSMLETWAAAEGIDASVVIRRIKNKGKAKDGRNGKSLKVTTVAKFRLFAGNRSRNGTLKIVGSYRPN